MKAAWKCFECFSLMLGMICLTISARGGITDLRVDSIVHDHAPTAVITDCASVGIFLEAHAEEVLTDCHLFYGYYQSINGFSSCAMGSDISVSFEDYYVPGEGCLSDIERVFLVQDLCGNSCTTTTLIHLLDTIGPAFTWSVTGPAMFHADSLALMHTPVVEDGCSLYSYSYESIVTPMEDGICGSYHEKLIFTGIDGCGNVAVDSVEYGVYPGFLSCVPTEFLTYDVSFGFTVRDMNNVVLAEVDIDDLMFTYWGMIYCLDMPPGCYEFDFYCSHPEAISNINFIGTSLSEVVLDSVIQTYVIGIGGYHCETGCLDPDACNYDPQSSGGGLCYEHCLGVDFGGGVIPPDSEFGFSISGLNGFYVEGMLPYSGTFGLDPFTTYTLTMYSSEPDGWGNNWLTFSIPGWNWTLPASFSNGSTAVLQFSTGGPGCMDQSACNYNPLATADDGSCIYGWGCMDPTACNYDPTAQCDNGTCSYPNAYFAFTVLPGTSGFSELQASALAIPSNHLSGCAVFELTDPNGTTTTLDPAFYGDGVGSVSYVFYEIPGTYSLTYVSCCMQADGTILTTSSTQTFEVLPCNQVDGLSEWLALEVTADPGATITYCITNLNEGIPMCESATFANGGIGSDGLCLLQGCYQVDISVSDGIQFMLYSGDDVHTNSGDPGVYSFSYTLNVGGELGCNDPSACNYDPESTCSDVSACLYITGCLDPSACNYNPYAQCGDDSCVFPGSQFLLNHTLLSCSELVLTMTSTPDPGWAEYPEGCWQYVIHTPDGLSTIIPLSPPDESGVSTTVWMAEMVLTGQYVVELTGCCYNTYGIISQSVSQQSFYIPETYAGCTDAASCDYDPGALCDDGSCTYCPEESWCFHVTMAHEGEEVMGGRFQLRKLDLNETVVLQVDLLPGQSYVDETVCIPLEPGCYVAVFENFSPTGVFTYSMYNSAWQQPIGPFSLIDAPIEVGYDLGTYMIDPGLSFTDFVGCMDPDAYTYDPEALCHDAFLCQYCDMEDRLFLSIGDSNPGEFDGTELWIYDPAGNNVAGLTNVNGMVTDTVVFCDQDLCGLWSVGVVPGVRIADLSFTITNAAGDTIAFGMPGFIEPVTLFFGDVVASFAPEGANCGCTDGYACNYRPDAIISWPESCLYCAGQEVTCFRLEVTVPDSPPAGGAFTPEILVTSSSVEWNLAVSTPHQGSNLLAFCAPSLQGCVEIESLLPEGAPYSYEWALYESGILLASGVSGDVVLIEQGMVISGCTDPGACNFNQLANCDDHSCAYAWGCTDPAATNFQPEAGCDDGSCVYCAEPFELIMNDIGSDGWEGAWLTIYGPDYSVVFESTLLYGNTDSVLFCLEPGCDQFIVHVSEGSDPSEVSWIVSRGEFSFAGNTGLHPLSSLVLPAGCTDPTAVNYDPEAVCDDESCEYAACAGDFNGDGTIGLVDLLGFLSVYGSSCP